MKKIYLLLVMLVMLLSGINAHATEALMKTNLPIATTLFTVDPTGMKYDYLYWNGANELAIDLADGYTVNIATANGYVVDSVTLDGENISSTGGLYQITQSQIAEAAALSGKTPVILITAKERPKTMVTIKGDNTKLLVRYLFQNISDSAWKNGELTLELTDLTLPVEVIAKHDCAINAVYYNGNTTNEIDESVTTYKIYGSVLKPGDNVFEIVAYDLNDLRTEYFTLKVKGSLFDVEVRRNGSASPLQSSELLSPIYFNPETELPIHIYSSTPGKYLYSVKVGDKEIPRSPEGDFWLEDIENGAVVNVVVNFPDVDVPIRFNFLNPDTERSIQSVIMKTILPREEWLADDFSVKLGSSLYVELNTEDYIVTATLDGVEYTKYFDLIVLEDREYVVDVDATPRNPYKVDIYYEGLPAHFKVYVGNLGAEYEMTGQEMTQIDVSRNQNRIRFVADEGWKIAGVYANGEECGLDTFVTEDTYYEVYIEPYERDLRTVIYYDPNADWVTRSVCLSLRVPGLEKIIPLEDGYNIVSFNKEDLPLLIEAMLPNDNTGGVTQLVNPVMYFNGMMYKFEDNPEINNLLAEVENGTVIKFYAEQQPEYNVTYSIENGAEATVMQNLITPVIIPGDETVLPGTIVEISPNQLGNIDVEVNGNPIAASTEGTFTFSIDEDTEVVIKNGDNTGLNTISGESRFEVYSLQGIRLMKSAGEHDLKLLPAGIYIVNGKKAVLNGLN